MTIIEELTQQFPVRKTKKQKAAFRTWVTERAGEMGYAAQADEKGYSRNVIIGDPETVEAVFTAHYDTAPRLPFPNMCTPKNKGIFVLIQLGMVLVMLGLGVVPGVIAGVLTRDPFIAFFVSYICILVVCGLMLFGPANPNCVNDNTSGVAAVLELMARLEPQQRTKAAFILFDNEEKGLLGSMSYAGKHKSVKTGKLIVNMDCVGDGETMLLLGNKKTRALPAWKKLTESMSRQTGRSLEICDMEKCIYPSDQANFTLGAAVCACSTSKRIGYYFSKIHTAKDTVCEQVNLDYLADGLADFLRIL